MRGNILVVDDEPGPRESLRMILKPGHDVRTACGGEEALQEVEREQPDLVFLDLRMPGMDGTEVLQRIKSAHPDVEVAIITAYAAVDSARLAIRCGAIDYLTKPYAVADVERIVERALAVRRQQHDAAVLAAQLAKMTETLATRTPALENGERQNVAEAVDHLQSMQSELAEDLEGVRALSELGEVAAEVTHDINNLLTVVLLDAQYLLMQIDAQRGAESDAIGQRVSRIVRAAEDCTTIIRRIKDFVRLNVNFRPSLLDPNELVNSALALKRGAVSATGKPVDLRAELGDVVPIYGDEVGLRTVLVNMIENSLDALDEGFVEVRTGFRGGYVRLHVCDNGSGMSPEVLAKATEAFFSANKPHGTGLGLSTADRIIRRHEGRLTIESDEGVGTTVTIELPLKAGQRGGVAAPVSAQPPVRRIPVFGPTDTPRQPGESGTVILADDEESIREFMASVLEADGYEVLRAKDGAEGLDYFRQVRERGGSKRLMVITDQEMPLMTGRELAAEVKQADRAIPVLIVSGYQLPDGPGLEDALLTKPFGIRDLLDRVQELISVVSATPV
jgi:signal transduction histidine kinase